MSRITCSIVLFNTSEDKISGIINSLVMSTVDVKILILDNSPDPIKYDFSPFINISYFKSDKNLGFSKAHNFLINKIINESDYHLVVNPDVFFDVSLIENLLIKMMDDRSIGLIIPKILYPDGSMQYVCKLLPTPFDLIIRVFNFWPFKKITLLNNYNYEMRFLDYSSDVNAPFLSGCFMFIKTDVFREIGMFDERFFMYAEDIDLSRRIHKKYKTIIHFNQIAYHLHAKESFKNIKLFLIHLHSVINYFNKWGWFFDSERQHLNCIVLDKYYKKIN